MTTPAEDLRATVNALIDIYRELFHATKEECDQAAPLREACLKMIRYHAARVAKGMVDP